jgi:hypothetical protein
LSGHRTGWTIRRNDPRLPPRWPVVRAWSESSIRIGLRSDNKDLIDDIYRRLRDKFHEKPEGLPYQYCLLELVKKV